MLAAAVAFNAGDGDTRCIRGSLAHHPICMSPQCVGHTRVAREAKRYLAQP